MNLVERVKNILLTPKKEWPVIEAEKTDLATLYKSYILILAAIGPVCALVGHAMFGVPGVQGAQVGMGVLLAQAVMGYLVTLIVVYVVGMIINMLAPTFGGQKNDMQALKVAAYGSTPGWVAGVLGLVPALALVALLAALYGIYLVYLGLPVLMKCPPERSAGYTVVVIVAVVVASLVLAVVLGMLFGLIFGAGMVMQGM